MTLIEYIVEVGDEVAARVLNAEERTIASWRRGERTPRPKKAFEIEKTLKGRVSFADCYRSAA